MSETRASESNRSDDTYNGPQSMDECVYCVDETTHTVGEHNRAIADYRAIGAIFSGAGRLAPIGWDIIEA